MLRLIGFFALATAMNAAAQPALVTSATTLSPGATTIRDATTNTFIPLATADITVRGAVLTINGKHAIRSLTVERNGSNVAGRVTHSAGFTYDADQGPGVDTVNGMYLTVTDNVVVQGPNGSLVGSSISASGLGFVSGQGPGAANGGCNTTGASHGGRGSEVCNINSLPVYGLWNLPTTMGSGGYNGSGGGVVRLSISGILFNDGIIEADGVSTGNYSGGAGGSILITTAGVEGIGEIRANGSRYGLLSSAGGSGGGRIAIYGTSTNYAGTVLARGGLGGLHGGAGTVYLNQGNGSRGTIIIDNGDQAAGITELPNNQTVEANVVVRNGARLGPPMHQEGMNVIIDGNVTVESDGYISGTGLGYSSGAGPGGARGDCNTTGASHGGRGSEICNINSMPVYGLWNLPTTMGSGGHNGSGGGAIRLTMTGILFNYGTIESDGIYTGNYSGGAGGSILITTAGLEGTGAIHANGSRYGLLSSAGGSGGGRIAIYGTSTNYTGTILARGGLGGLHGGAGTVYLNQGNGSRGTIIIDNDDQAAGITELPSGEMIDANIIIRNSGRLGPRAHQDGMNVVIGGNVTVESDGYISGNGLGYYSAEGPGGARGDCNTTGASHGGRGSEICNVLAKQPYGLWNLPTMMGSGGYNGSGGGAVRLSIAGILFNYGTIESDGITTGSYSGGSGGSILITTAGLEGTGAIHANGARYGLYSNAGGSGGGRVAIYGTSSNYAGTILARGGLGGLHGGAGTVYLNQGNGSRGTIIIDNGDQAAGITQLPSGQMLDVNIIVRNAGRLGPSHEAGLLDLRISGELTVETDGYITALGLGYAPNSGPGAAGGCANTSGAGHGGRGAPNNCHPGGAAYGSITQPDTFGSGGYSGAGGGALRISASGIECDGVIDANGDNRGNFSGGAGGSIFITTPSLTGNGRIQALGARYGLYSNAGGSGGGRVAIYSCDVQIPLANFSVAGGLGGAGGQSGSLYFGSSNIVYTQQPVGAMVQAGTYMQLGVEATSTTPVTFQWRRKNGDGEFVHLVEGQDETYFNVTDSTLFVSQLTCTAGGTYDCLVCDACGCFPSEQAVLVVDSPGDFNQDGGIDGADVDAFFAAWSAGDSEADANIDGGVDGSDVDFFFRNWSNGC